jgi:hypothetical protein
VADVNTGDMCDVGHGLCVYRVKKLDCDEFVAALMERVARDVSLFKGKFDQYDVFK